MTEMRQDLKRAVKLVEGGMSYAEASRAIGGLTRNAVAGACDRAGVKTGRPQFAYNEGQRQRISTKAIEHWRAKTPRERASRLAGVARTWHDPAFQQRSSERMKAAPRDHLGRLLPAP